MIEGTTLGTIYWCTLLTRAGLAVLLIIFGDVFDSDGPLNPVLIIPWLTSTSSPGSLGECLIDRPSLSLFIASGDISIALVFLPNFHILVLMKRTESMMLSSEKTLEGQVAVTITPIPVQGMGEIQSKGVTGSISRPACSYNPQEQTAEWGTKVLIVGIKERTRYVVPYESMIKA